MSMHKFHGNWRYFISNENSGTRWYSGQMLVYCLGGKHWRIALLQETDPLFCREFRLATPENQIREARIRQDILLHLYDGTSINMDGLTPLKLSEMSKLMCTIRQQKITVENPDQVTPSSEGKYVYNDKNLGYMCLEGFHRLCEQDLLTDVTLVAQGEEYRCHRALLAANSSYFHAMLCGNFVERSTDRVTLSEISGPTVKLILQYLYTGEVEIDADSVQLLFNASHMLQLVNLEGACVSYMLQNLSDNNAIGVYFFAKNFDKSDLKDAAAEKISGKFQKITKASEYLHLSGEEVADILQMSTVLHCSEEDVYLAALRWLEFDMPTRQEDMYRVMKSIRFVHMDECFFRERVKNRGIFRGCRQLQVLFEQVIYYMNHPYRWHELDLVMEPRRSKRTGCPPRAVLYSSRQQHSEGVGGGISKGGGGSGGGGGGGGRTMLEMYTRQRDTSTYLSEWRTWPTDDLCTPAMATLEAPSRGIYLAGGTRNGKLFIKLDLSPRSMGTFANCTWYKLASLHHSREQFSLIAVDRFLYAVGGCQKNTNLDSVEKYIIGRNQWVKVAALPCRLRCSCAVSYRGRMYVFGGESQTKKNRKRNLSPNVFCYDPETDRWSTLCPMKTARALAGCAVLRGNIYVIGGMGSLSSSWVKSESPDTELATCEVFNPLTNTWTEGPSLPEPLASPGVIKYMGNIYVMGGLNSGSPSRCVYHLDEAGERWLPASTDMYHQACNATGIHSMYLPVSLGANNLTNSDSDSETTCGTSMEHFDMDSSSHSSDLTGYPNASWDTESSSSGF